MIVTFGTKILGNIISFLGETLCRGLVKAFLGILQSYNFYGCTLGGLKIDFGDPPMIKKQISGLHTPENWLHKTNSQNSKLIVPEVPEL